MKLRQIPADFQVEEVADFTPDPAGGHFVYRLRKRGLATLEALQILARSAGIKPSRLSAAGLKDKHAETTQLFSAPKPLPPESPDPRLELSFVGKVSAPLTAAAIVANHFVLTLRGLGEDEVSAIPRNAEEMIRFGIPNYYDNQRFGGIAHGRGFLARALILGDWEAALRLHLAAPHRKQSLRDKRNRQAADKHWGDWETLHRKMRPSSERALVEYLRDHPGDYRGCLERITPGLRNLFLAAYQSFLFNETVRRFLEAQEIELTAVRNKAGEVPMYHRLPEPLLEAWRGLEFPLPGPSTRLEEFPEAGESLQAALDAEGVALEAMALPGLARTGFRAASRALLLFPAEFSLSPFEADELNPGRRKAVVRFRLPRGAFATMVTRRLVLGTATPDSSSA